MVTDKDTIPAPSSEEYSVRTGWAPKVVVHMGPGKLATALAKAQGEMEGASKDRKNPAFNSKYADLASVWDAVREPLSKHGLSIVQLPCPALAGEVGLVTTLLHESGESISQVFYMPVKDAKNAQAVGSALTYARRYALMAVCGIAPEDDDGNVAAGRTPAPVQVNSATRPVDTAAIKQQLEGKFAAADLEAKKAVFAEARASQLPEPVKTDLLTSFSEVIKAAQPKGKK
jgi:hypothetical protein